MTAAAMPRPMPVLADLAPGARVRDLAFVLGGTALIAGFSQVTVHLPFTPVPLSLSTFAVLLTGLALGPARALVSTILYLVLGTVGLPIFGEASSGWSSASYGYIIGYIAAAAFAGVAARRAADRSVLRTAGATALATCLVYACGVPWLMAFTGMGFTEALALGVLPFLIGDALKAAAASVLLPSTWRLLGRAND